jgi:galactokinase
VTGVRRIRTMAGALVRGGVPVAGLAIRMIGWSIVLPGLKVVLPLETLVRLMRRRPRRRRHDGAGVGRIVHVAHRTLRSAGRDNCLERSLLVYRYLSAAGAEPVLVIGARTGTSGVEGHVWLLVDGDPVGESAAELAQYEPVTAFDAAGRRTGVTPGVLR